MIGKIMKAASFSRCVHYVTGKEDARILASDGVLLTTTQDIIDSFEFQRQMNPRISDDITFKASQIKRGLSFEGILSKLNSNAKKDQQQTFNSQAHHSQTEQPRQETYSKQQERNEPSIGIPSLGLFDTSNPVYDPAEEEFRRRMQRKKKKRGPRL